MINLYGLDREALAGVLADYRAPRFHAGQIYRWMYRRGHLACAGWTDLPESLRERLAADTTVAPGRITDRTEAADGTIKYRFELPGGDSVETVYMEQAGRVTFCVSSQVGCALACAFCLTGKMGLRRHLDPGEILGQVAAIRRDRQLEGAPFNIVFMGMGEPLHNYDGLTAALRVLHDPEGFGMSRRRTTVSTAGMAEAVERLAEEPSPPRLAVSLNATTDETRERLMPITRKYPIARLLAACRVFAERTRQRVSFEYVLLEGVNDSDGDVDRLTGLIRPLAARLNLIPFNPVPGWLPYTAPPRARVLAIRDRLLERGVRVSIRWSRGAEARAACGQLALLPASPDSESAG